MPKQTENLQLFKTDMETDGNEYFNFEKDLGENWDKIDSAIGKLSELTTSDKENIVGAINEIETSIKNKTDQSLSSLSSVGLDKINQSKALETGSVSSDADVYADIQKYAHSTFDLSKFEVVGSPVITEDGIASGFESSNYIKCGGFSFSKMLSFKGVKFRTGDVSGSTKRDIIDAVCINFNMFVLRVEDGELKLVSSTGGIKSIVYVKNNTNYIVDLDFDSEQEECAVTVIENDTTVTTKTLEFTFTGRTLSYFVIGCRYTGGILNSFDGSIDLKSIAVWADGVPVFNGNKTGLYIAKSDNYEVVGSPTITEDGVVSNIPIGVNIKSLEAYSLASDFTIISPTITVNSFIDNTPIAFCRWSSNFYLSIGADFWVWSIIYVNKDGTKTLEQKRIQNISIELKKKYVVKFEQVYKDSKYIRTLKVYDSKDLLNPIGEYSYESIYPIYEETDNNKIEIVSSPNKAIDANFDLNTCKFYSKGNLVYQPCLKIPYALSKTGSKIVDAAYRDRVQDLYEQTGEALFYTIDEENQDFTLPSGDIYGMITKNREILDIVYPIGRPMPEENNVLLDNEVWLEGATVNPVDYPKLFEVYGTKYGGDGITTFGLPDFRGRTIWGSSDGSSGYIEAQLPNINGVIGKIHFGTDAGLIDTQSGALIMQNSLNVQEHAGTGNKTKGGDLTLNASLSNSIYSDDATTVQPPAFKVRWKTRFE